MAYDNTNRAVLFKNENKKTETHPDYSGSLNFEGVECFLDAWVKTAESGRKFMSLSVKRKDKQAAAPAPARKPSQDGARSRQVATQRDEFDDGSSIPF
jgi:uncharacterized protein (DUF736 family)